MTACWIKADFPDPFGPTTNIGFPGLRFSTNGSPATLGMFKTVCMICCTHSDYTGAMPRIFAEISTIHVIKFGIQNADDDDLCGLPNAANRRTVQSLISHPISGYEGLKMSIHVATSIARFLMPADGVGFRVS